METFDRSLLIDILSREAAGDGVSAAEREYAERWCAASPANEAIRRRIANGGSLAKRCAATSTQAMLRGIDRKLAARKRRRIAVGAASAAAVVTAALFLVFGPATEIPQRETPVTAAILTLADGREVVLSGDDSEDVWQQYVESAAVEQAGDTRDTPAPPIKITIPHGNKYKLRLDDGTLVWLNEETVFEYPERFTGGAREVRLTGEAYFEVARDTAKPFSVATTDGIRVSVLGTQFNVNSYEDLAHVKVTLVEGSVSVAGSAGEVVLTPDQQAVFDRRTASVSVAGVDAPGYMEWIYGMFAFEHTPLRDVLDEIAAWYGIELEYDAKTVRRFGTVNFHAVRYADHARVLDMLSKMTNLEYTVKE